MKMKGINLSAMKRLLQILFFILCVTPAFAQEKEKEVDPDEEVQIDPKAKEKINAARIAYITERLGLTPEEAEKFWPVYREYSQKRKEIRQQFKTAKEKGTSED